MRDPRDFWRRRRTPTVRCSDAWSGGGEGFRAWMNARPTRDPHHGMRGRARTPWTLFGIVLGLVLAMFLAAPLVWARSLEPCEALETALINRQRGPIVGVRDPTRWLSPLAGRDLRSLSRGQVGEQIASQEYRGWPHFVGCTMLFWQVRASAHVASE